MGCGNSSQERSNSSFGIAIMDSQEYVRAFEKVNGLSTLQDRLGVIISDNVVVCDFDNNRHMYIYKSQKEDYDVNLVNKIVSEMNIVLTLIV